MFAFQESSGLSSSSPSFPDTTSTAVLASVPLPKLYVVDGDTSYATPWLRLFALTDDHEKADCFLFTGGADINPNLYGDENIHGLCSYYHARDQREVPYFHYAVDKQIPIIGICRGAQLATALSGGKLFHHVEGHDGRGGGMHQITTSEGRKMWMSSLHHQMCRPVGEVELLAWSDHLSGVYATATDLMNFKPDFDEGDPEMFWLPEVKALCIQGHPEFMDERSQGVEYCLELASKYILNQ